MPAMLSFTTGAWRGLDVAIPDAGARIGRDAGLDIVIPPEDQRFVSRVHAVIRVEDGRYVIEDRGSTNGTLVNGREVTRAVLRDGDEIQFGRKGPVARFRARSTPAGDATVQADDDLVRRLRGQPRASAVRPRPRAMLIGASGTLFVAAAWAAATQFGAAEDPGDALRRFGDEYEDRVVLVEVGLRLRGEYRPLGSGTGFFAAEGGYIITNKHVTHSHFYSLASECRVRALRRRGIELEDSLVITVWQGGTRFRHTPVELGDRGLGYSTEHGTLKLVALTPNNLRPPRRARCNDPYGGPAFEIDDWRGHYDDNNDLVVLRAAASAPFIPLAEAEPPSGEPVMVLGFPRGIGPLETNIADPIRRFGQVLRVQETIHIDAVVLGGNSGGPLIDPAGRVVGITTAGYAESLNIAIKAEYARRLLDRARAVPLQ
jgi:pSer/pThr/pTyr-binding forkhead associated (FHA) protein